MNDVRREVEVLIARVGHWGPPRWTVAVQPAGTRADLIHALVQRLADLAATAEGRVRRHVPRLENDLALPDQLRVMAADLAAAGADPAVLATAAADVAATRACL
ncbi:MAG TPA: hypothetical protein VFE14_15630 [Micromonosporaceae bacterium]|jgi:hypothetical protein|nr:hypothetical protein [Micromonosporaceae bacterium]